MSPETSPSPVRVALTGGPCSGKTSALAVVTQYFGERGYDVVRVPEAATVLMATGLTPDGFPGETIMEFQRGIFGLIKSLEDNAVNLAKARDQVRSSTKPTIILFDRGLIDGSVFCSKEAFGTILTENGMTLSEARDARYDLVLHLATAPKEFYGTENNVHRHHSYEESMALDCALRRAWTGHPRLKIINNRSDFDVKLQRVISAICAAVGEPQPYGCKRKFLLEGTPDILRLVTENGIHVESSIIQQTYLASENGSSPRLRQRTSRGTSLHYFTERGPAARPGRRPNRERIITPKEYDRLIGNRMPGTQTLVKKRHCFVWEDAHFEVDIYEAPLRNLSILEIQLESKAERPALPPFLKISREVTDDVSFSASTLAEGQ